MLKLPGMAIPTTTSGMLTLLIVLVGLWMVVSIPVYIAGKLVTGGRASYGRAMGATLGGAVGYFVVFYGAGLFPGAMLGSPAVPFAFILALIFWLAVYKSSFGTGWIGALGIVLVAWVALLILDAILAQTFGVAIPKFYPF